MKQEVYQRVVEINGRIEELEEVLKELDMKERNSFLTYAYHSYYTSDRSLGNQYILNNISAILKKHDEMIRKEIQEEIDNLKKEIESL